MHLHEPFRLHKIHCRGCSEYRNHGGEWTPDTSEGHTLRDGRNEGFDSPPPPPHVHTVECNDC